MNGKASAAAVAACAPRTMILLDPELEPDATSRRNKPVAVPTSMQTQQVSGAQRIPSARTLARFLADAQEAVRLRGQVTVLLTTDAAIRRLNRRFRAVDKATDVLSFPAGEELPGQIAGDLAISVPTAMRQARDQGHAVSVEVKVLILHGLLHLAGYDHETDRGEMARRERVLRVRLGLPQGLIERVSSDTVARQRAHR